MHTLPDDPSSQSADSVDSQSLTRARELLRMFGKALRSTDERESIKNLLVMELVARFKPKIIDCTQGRIGIDDRQTDLVNSAFIYLRERATQIAHEIDMHDLPLAYVVSKWIRFWAVDKIRTADGNTLKRGKGLNKQDLVHEIAGDQPNPLDSLIADEAAQQIKTAIEQAMAKLEALEQAVILSYFGLDDGGDLKLREVAEALGVKLSVVVNANERAKRKLKAWLEEDPALH